MTEEKQGDKKISVEVAYATPEKQVIVPLRVVQGCTMYEAAKLANLEAEFPEVDVDTMPMGVFGKADKKPKDRVLQEGDRVEVYRPLIADPKASRKKRAEKAAAAKKEQGE